MKENEIYLAEDDEINYAYQKALRYLGFRSRSQKEVEDYLIRKRFAPEVVERVMEKLKEYGFIDDLVFAANWVRNRMQNSPKSRTAMAIELRQKGVDVDIIDEAIAWVSVQDEEAAALKLAEKYYQRYRGLEKRDRVYKTAQALGRRGFDWEVVQMVIRRWM